jgi:hypothetical protein
MAPEFLDMDRFALYRLAHLVDLAHWCPGDIKLEAEIARQEQRFGLTPLDRRRLQWEVKRVEGEKHKPPRAAPSETDPRSVLRAVK